MFLIHLGIDLRGREIGVAEQFLDFAQITAIAQKMGGEAVAKGVRGGGVGQTQRTAQALHDQLNDARRKTLALFAKEQGIIGVLCIGTMSARYSAIASIATGRTGTMRSLPPLPLMRNTSFVRLGASHQHRD